MKAQDPDRALREVDDEDEFRHVILDSEFAEDLFCKRYLDMELDPWQIFSVKLIRGRFHNQGEIDRFIEEYDLHWINDNGQISISDDYWIVPNILILWPAGHGKTTVVTTRVIPTMEICDNPNSRTQFIGKNETEAFSFSTAIRRELANPRLVADFGAFKPVDKSIPWSNQAFSVNQRQWTDVRENFEFYGTNSHAALGKRSDRVLIDDVETPDTARTAEQRQKLLEWTRIGPLTSPRPLWKSDAQGNVLRPKHLRWSNTSRYWGTGVVGTIFNPEALYAMLQADPTFSFVRFDCYRDKRETIALQENLMSVEKLDRERRSLGILAFNKRFRNIAFNEEEMAFRESWFRGHTEIINGVELKHPGCLETKRSFGEFDPSWEIYVGFDPASGSKSRWSAYAAYFVLGFDPLDDARNVHVIDYFKIQDNFDRMLDNLLDGNPNYGIPGLFATYHYKTATVEKNAFGKWMVENDRIKPFIDQNVIQAHYTGTNKVDPEAGVFAMGEMMQNGRLRIPYKEPADQEKANYLINRELCVYPKGTCDLVMALWLAQRPLQQQRTKYRSWFGPNGAGTYVRNPAYA